ncbi:MAG: hypothetical protein ISR75_03600 [Phycisphaerales bacterium]|nr:hypothetical protein [Planctomycetota bacterium]MBL6997503.1 hypothetical protein [Phycisphaerales bacterium]
MRAYVAIIATILALAFDSSFGGVLTLRSVGSITPLAMPCLLVFIALFAPETVAILVTLLLGILVDLSPGHGELSGGAHLIGPHALGFLITTFLVLKIRNIVFRRRVLTIASLAAIAVIITGATEALVLLIRGILPWTPEITSGGFSGLIKLFGTAIYSGLLAVPLGWCLLGTIGVWKFHSPTGRRATWR